jgi:hypothetical protein
VWEAVAKIDPDLGVVGMRDQRRDIVGPPGADRARLEIEGQGRA